MIKESSWVVRGSQRKKILEALENPKIPTQLKEETKLSLNNVSDVLKVLSEKGLVKCINPLEKTGRFYELTTKGSKVREELVGQLK
jgi:DNA-binding MarR family transcriptional regulator